MKKPRKALLDRAHLGAPLPENIAFGGAGRSNRHDGRQRRLPHRAAALTSEIPARFIIHHFSVFGNYLRFY